MVGVIFFVSLLVVSVFIGLWLDKAEKNR